MGEAIEERGGHLGIYNETGKLRAVQILLGHTIIDNTVRCLGSISTTRSSLPSGLRFDPFGSSSQRRAAPCHLNQRLVVTTAPVDNPAEKVRGIGPSRC
jgi:hypothetical protein